MTDENRTDPTDVGFTGEAPPTQTPPDIPDPNMLYFVDAMGTFHKYVLYMFEQFQEDIFDLQRRLQIAEGLVDAHNHVFDDVTETLTNQVGINGSIFVLLQRMQEQLDEQDETLLYLQDRAILTRDPKEVVISQEWIYPNTGKPPI